MYYLRCIFIIKFLNTFFMLENFVNNSKRFSETSHSIFLLERHSFNRPQATPTCHSPHLLIQFQLFPLLMQLLGIKLTKSSEAPNSALHTKFN